MSACSRTAPERTLDILERMHAPRDVVTYNTAMAAALHAEDPQRSLELMVEMDSKGLSPSTISFNTAISACAKAADWETALKLFRRMETEGVERSTITYTGL